MRLTVPTSIAKTPVLLSNKVMKESDYPGIGQHKHIFKWKKKKGIINPIKFEIYHILNCMTRKLQEILRV